ncbi:MAG TPA: MarR family winged helix-turn-helix transcriptional regulator [Gammaproteobacteria bacterium]|nr:MarR family winged helix-turn-helix transcriptional regulator [Gammaproteobacteria bacterium]
MAREPDNSLKLEEFLPYRLSVLSNTVSSAIAAAYAERFELSVPEWRVLAILGRYPGLSAGEVAGRAAMDKVAVSRAVTRLLEAGRINRRFANADRRRSILELSAKGRAVHAKVTPVARYYERALLEGLSATERKHFDQLLDKLLRRAYALGPATPPSRKTIRSVS